MNMHGCAFYVCNHISILLIVLHLAVKYFSKCGRGSPHGDKTSGDLHPPLDKNLPGVRRHPTPTGYTVALEPGVCLWVTRSNRHPATFLSSANMRNHLTGIFLHAMQLFGALVREEAAHAASNVSSQVSGAMAAAAKALLVLTGSSCAASDTNGC